MAGAAETTSAASSSSMTMREGAGSSAGGASSPRRREQTHASGSTASRMHRTINTIPSWVRQHDSSPAQSPELSPQREKGNDAGNATWPRQKKHDAHNENSDDLQDPSALSLERFDSAAPSAMPEPRGGPTGEIAGSKKQHNDSADARSHDSSSSGSSTHDQSGPGRFWSVSFPRRIQRPTQAFRGRSARQDLVTRKRGKSWYEIGNQQPMEEDEEDEADRASSSEASTRNHRASAAFQRRRSSFGQSYRGALSDTIVSLAAGGYMGRGMAKRYSSHDIASEDEQGSPGITRHGLDADINDEEKQLSRMREGTRGGWSNDSSRDADAKRQRGRGEGNHATNDQSFSRHQVLTPGWESPWRPESRGEHSIRIGRYRFNNHGEGSYFPRSSTRGSDRKRGDKKWSLLSSEWWSVFLLHNAFVPLLIRLINVAFTTSTLAIAIRLFRVLREQDAEEAVGSSPIVAIIFAPLTLLHVGIQIYLEYFSKPIGLWRISSKLFYTLTELIFVCLWSAELSLAFDNYLTSTLVCTSFQSPYSSAGDPSGAPPGQMLDMPGEKPHICTLQRALIALVFISLLAYVIVFSLSLFRTFARVSKH